MFAYAPWIVVIAMASLWLYQNHRRRQSFLTGLHCVSGNPDGRKVPIVDKIVDSGIFTTSEATNFDFYKYPNGNITCFFRCYRGQTPLTTVKTRTPGDTVATKALAVRYGKPCPEEYKPKIVAEVLKTYRPFGADARTRRLIKTLVDMGFQIVYAERDARFDKGAHRLVFFGRQVIDDIPSTAQDVVVDYIELRGKPLLSRLGLT